MQQNFVHSVIYHANSVVYRAYNRCNLLFSTLHVMDIAFFIACNKNILSFGFIKALDLKGIINMPIKGIKSAMDYVDIAAFTLAT